ncbi:MAG TPA: YhcH/YjgK/YiaL family protein [Williamwhitmania sp.]|nr:YhcH/YjgK/YiaL family protein [Williamwhitmania sp.]
MIFDKKESLLKYRNLLPGLDLVNDYLVKGEFDYDAGPINLQGDKLFVSPFSGVGKARHEAKLEVHRRYIDLQLLMEGNEEIGWCPLSLCHQETTPYDEEKDIAFYRDSPRDFLKLTPGYFAVFFPDDAHAPLIGEDIKKMVFKFLVE